MLRAGWESRVAEQAVGCLQPSSPQAVVILGGTFMQQVSAQASDTVIKSIKNPQKP